MSSELEKKIAQRYQRITGIVPVGLIDTLRILTGPDMLPLIEEYIDEVKQ